MLAPPAAPPAAPTAAPTAALPAAPPTTLVEALGTVTPDAGARAVPGAMPPGSHAPDARPPAPNPAPNTALSPAPPPTLPCAVPAPAPASVAALEHWRRRWRAQPAACWVFAYGSLIWRPGFDAAEQHAALVHGWHRALRMASRSHRGTPQQPGLVFALLPGGACRGVAYRLDPAQADAELQRLWEREMPWDVYRPRALSCRTADGAVQALAFTLDRRHEACRPRLSDDELLHVLRHAQGRYGTTLAYLAETAAALRRHRVRDREVERQLALAQRHGLL